MVVATTACVGVIITGGAAVPVISAAATSGGGFGVAGAAVGTAKAIGGAVGVAASSGAIAGATATGTAAGASIGAAIGGTAAAGVGGSGAGVASIFAGTALSGGIGFLVLGTSTKQEDEHITYDCWKPVVHDVSEEPSNGMYLKDLFSHQNIQKVTMATDCSTSLPNIVIENIWKEEFQIEYMMLNTTGEIVCHAKQM
ncbi:Golgi-associated RAB2B interactor protein 3-like [Mytilus edulis]|uniref:Golgi-associated RAB2B interactor protein 3-like n=1 Tax=Mytilus edulis TaxID=6550 RepID=UPI0039F040BB